MYQQHYFVPKATGTLTDTLLAFGAATLIRQFVRSHLQDDKVILRDAGSYYLIDAGVPVQEEWLTESWEQQLFWFVVSAKNKVPDDLAPLAASHSVDDTWDEFLQYQELRKQLRDEKLANDEIKQVLEDRKPQSDWTVITYLGDFRMQAQATHNKLGEQWMRTNKQFPGLNLRTVFELFASPTADWDAIAGEWQKAVGKGDFNHMVTASQLFNPHMGKGQNRTKANKLTMGNEKGFWLLEFLKAVGLWAAAVPTINAGVRKTYILAPQEIEMSRHQRIFSQFRDRLWNEGVVKQDIMASLLYTEVLLEHSIEDDALDIFADGGVSSVVNGMGVATYQLLSANSYTMMNLAFLGLPDWVPGIRTFEDARQYIAVLQEHRERIRNIDEDRSEGYALLQLYRDFLSGNYLAPFYEFLVGYSSYLISALNRSRFYVKPFSETHLRRLFEMTNPALAPILEDEGFRNVADAIRKSTLSMVYIDRRKRRYDIRYGLGQELMRKAQYKEDFIQELTEFMHSFNDETLRVYERTKGETRRKLITTQDIRSVVKLVDEHSPKTVCNLLVAFGYARDPREQPDEESEQTGETE